MVATARRSPSAARPSLELVWPRHARDTTKSSFTTGPTNRSRDAGLYTMIPGAYHRRTKSRSIKRGAISRPRHTVLEVAQELVARHWVAVAQSGSFRPPPSAHRAAPTIVAQVELLETSAVQFGKGESV